MKNDGRPKKKKNEKKKKSFFAGGAAFHVPGQTDANKPGSTYGPETAFFIILLVLEPKFL